MSDTDMLQNVDQPKGSPCTKEKKNTTALRVLGEAAVFVTWLYIVIKIFVFDVDTYAVENYAPSFAGLLKYKFFILIAIFTSALWFLKNKWWLAYFAFYPIILFVWHMPMFIFKRKSWSLMLAYVNAIFDFFSNLKYSSLVFAIYAISVLSAFISDENAVLYTSSAMIFSVLLITYLRRTILVFRPSRLFAFYRKTLGTIKSSVLEKNALNEDIKALTVAQLNKTQLELWANNLSAVVIFNRSCLFIAHKFRNYQCSGLPIMSGVVSIIGLIIFTAFTFAVIDYSIYKADTGAFDTLNGRAQPFFEFFYYSFNAIHYGSIREITASSQLAQSVLMAEYLCAAFLFVILVGILMSVKSERYSRELDDIISTFEREGQEMEQYIRCEFKIETVQDAISELQKLQAALIKFILFLSGGLTAK